MHGLAAREPDGPLRLPRNDRPRRGLRLSMSRGRPGGPARWSESRQRALARLSALRRACEYPANNEDKNLSTSALGAGRVGAVISTLAANGYRAGRLSASGQRRGARREENMIPGDLIALAPPEGGLPHLLIEVGGIGKRLGVAFAELREGLAPGFVPLVVRFVARRRWYYVDEDTRLEDLTEALTALREA